MVTVGKWRKNLKKNFIFIICLILFSGCTKLQYIDELLTLKGMADSVGEMDEVVEEGDAKFEALMKEVREGRKEGLRGCRMKF